MTDNVTDDTTANNVTDDTTANNVTDDTTANNVTDDTTANNVLEIMHTHYWQKEMFPGTPSSLSSVSLRTDVSMSLSQPSAGGDALSEHRRSNSLVAPSDGRLETRSLKEDHTLATLDIADRRGQQSIRRGESVQSNPEGRRAGPPRPPPPRTQPSHELEPPT
ncbi:PREDICTED: uncharacterized protein LOC106819576, partial [Priapulus caudatus]|uniref:Uncharacterized protein LOC106819576 n=1 Tax=Priapulus caudatus TaxID=37621 RepID=A0ABM1F5F4_PRICU